MDADGADGAFGMANLEGVDDFLVFETFVAQAVLPVGILGVDAGDLDVRVETMVGLKQAAVAAGDDESEVEGGVVAFVLLAVGDGADGSGKSAEVTPHAVDLFDGDQAAGKFGGEAF